jgi:hypothetical protein
MLLGVIIWVVLIVSAKEQRSSVPTVVYTDEQPEVIDELDLTEEDLSYLKEKYMEMFTR